MKSLCPVTRMSAHKAKKKFGCGITREAYEPLLKRFLKFQK